MAQRSLLISLYLPTFLLSVCEGLLIPTLPIYAQTFGASFSLVSLVVGAAALGRLAADIPAGVILERFGRKPVMLAGALTLSLATFALALAHVVPELAVYRLLDGLGSAMWSISRMAYISDVIAPAQRGRVIASFGGASRLGTFVGPALGGFLAQQFGLTTPFLAAAAMALAAFVLSALAVDSTAPGATGASRKLRWHLLAPLVVKHRRDLVAAGGTQVCMQMIRAGRQLIVPLYGTAVLGLDVASVGTIVSISAAIDMSLFAVAGHVMDKYGRKAAVVPSFLLMGLGILLIPLSSGFLGLLGAMCIVGLGNGFGSGTMMTIGSDLAPQGARGEFLGIWRFIGDGGAFGGPVVVGGIADAIGLSASALAMAGVGLAAAVVVAFFVEETLRPQKASAPG